MPFMTMVVPQLGLLNPSPIDTHWYVDLQQTWRDDDTWGGGVGQKAIGSFSNSDFQEDDEYTYVDHEVTVWGYKNGTIDYEAIEEARAKPVFYSRVGLKYFRFKIKQGT